MNNRERFLTGSNLKKQKSRILKMEDGLWDEITSLANYLTMKKGYKISNSECIRRILTKYVKEVKK